MYKYTYIQAAGGKRITKRHKVCVLTIAGERANDRRNSRRERSPKQSPQRSPPDCTQAPAAGRSTTPTTGTRAHAPTRTGWRCVQASGSGCRLVLLVLLALWLDICPLFLTARRGWYSLSARSISPENKPKNKAAGRTVRRRH